MIYVTGDCHGDWHRFTTRNFPEQKEMCHDDYVIVCGDFGLWHDTNEERWWLDWLNDKSFTTLFIDGNHENFDRLYSDEFEVVDFHGGKAHKIRDNIYHLMRGYVFELCGKKIFAFGGASSHDIQQGILRLEDYRSKREMLADYKARWMLGERIRVNHLSWWEQELPSDEEMKLGIDNLAKVGNKVDFVISHCAPQHIASYMSMGGYKPDKLTQYFNEISNSSEFTRWYFGHYHKHYQVSNNFMAMYDHIERIA